MGGPTRNISRVPRPTRPRIGASDLAGGGGVGQRSGLISGSQLRDLQAGQIAQQYQEPAPYLEVPLDITQSPQIPEGIEAELEAGRQESQEQQRQAEEEQRNQNVLFKALDWYDRNWSIPWASIWLSTIGNFDSSIGEQYSKAWQEAEEKGEATSFWSKLNYAYHNTDTPTGLKFWLEVLGDPTNYIPLGGWAKGAITGGIRGTLVTARMLARGQARQLGRNIGSGISTAARTTTARTSQSTRNNIERVLNKARGRPFATQDELIQQQKNVGESVHTETLIKDHKTMDQRITERLKNLWSFKYSPFADPDLHALQDAQNRYDYLTAPKGTGRARGTSGAEKDIPELKQELEDLQRQAAQEQATPATMERIGTVEEILELRNALDRWNARYSWILDWKLTSRWSPLYYMFKGARGVGHHVFMMKSLSQPYAHMASTELHSARYRAAQQSQPISAKHMFAPDPDNPNGVKKVYSRPGGLRYMVNQLGRAFNGLNPLHSPQGNTLPDQMRDNYLNVLRMAGVENPEEWLRADDVIVSGATAMTDALKRGNFQEHVLFTLQRQWDPDTLYQFRLKWAEESADHRNAENFGDTIRFLQDDINVKRAKDMGEAGEMLKARMAEEPDLILHADNVRINIYVLGDSSGRQGIYAKDDIFGMRIEWDPIVGKTLGGDDLMRNVNMDTPIDEYRKITGAAYADEDAVFVMDAQGRVQNLVGYDDPRKLQLEFHAHQVLAARWHDEWLRKNRPDIGGDPEGRYINVQAPDDINEILTDEMKRELERAWISMENMVDAKVANGTIPDDIDGLLMPAERKQVRDLFKAAAGGDVPRVPTEIADKLTADQLRVLENRLMAAHTNGVIPLSMADRIKGWLHREAFAKPADAEALFDTGYLRQLADGTAFGSPPSFTQQRAGTLMDNTRNGVQYVTSDELPGRFWHELGNFEAAQEHAFLARKYSIADLGTDFYVKSKHLAAANALITLAQNVRRDLDTPDGRLRYLQDVELEDRVRYQMRRLREDMGHYGDQVSGQNYRSLVKAGHDIEQGINQMLDANRNPQNKTRRLVFKEPGKSGDVRSYSTDEQMNSLRRHLLNKISGRNGKPQRVWVETRDVDETVSHLLHTREDVEGLTQLLAQMRDKFGTENTKAHRIWLTDPAESSSTRFRGVYETVDIRMTTGDARPLHANEIGISQMEKVARWMEPIAARFEAGETVDPEQITTGIFNALFEGLTDAQTEDAASAMHQIRELLSGIEVNLPDETVDDLFSYRSGRVTQDDVRAQSQFNAVKPVIDHIVQISNTYNTPLTRANAMRTYIGRLQADLFTLRKNRIEYWAEVKKSFTADMLSDLQANDLARLREEVTASKARLDDSRHGSEVWLRPIGEKGERFFGGRPGDMVGGQYYRRSGASPASGDIRRARYTPIGAKNPNTAEGVMQEAIVGYTFDGRRVPHLASHGLIMDKKAIELWSRVAPDPNHLLTKVSKLVERPNNAMRLLNVGFDAGSFMLQGVSLLAIRPDIFGATMIRTLPALIDPDTLPRYMAMHYDDFMDMTRHGVVVASSRFEAFRALGASNPDEVPFSATPHADAGMTAGIREGIISGPLGRVQMAPGINTRGGTTPLGHVTSSAFGLASYAFQDVASRFEQVYNGTLVARHMMWSSLKDSWLRVGGTEAELADWLNHMTGFIDLGGQGLSQMQQSVERNLLFFSTHYTRSAMALVGDAMRGGIAGAAATATIGSMMLGGMLYYYGIATALGQEPKLDPRPMSAGGDGGQFMTVSIKGHNVGIGTIWVQLARLVAGIGEKDWTDPSLWLQPDLQENDIFRFWRNRTPPVVDGADQLIRAAFRQPMYLGQRLEGASQHVNQFATNFVPFSVDTALLQKGPNVGSLFAGVAEFAGLREFPISVFERYSIARDDAAFKEFDKRWLELDKRQQDWLRNHPNHQRINELQSEISADRRIRRLADEADIGLLTDVYFEMLEAPLKIWQSELTELLDMLDRGVIDTVGFRQSLSIANRDYNARRHIQNDPLFDEVREALEEAFNRGVDLRQVQPQDIAWREYMFDVIGAADQSDIDEYDWQLRQRLESEFRQRWGNEVYTYVQERFRGSREAPDWHYPDILVEYYGGLENYASWYWNEIPLVVISTQQDQSEAMRLWQLYTNAPRTEKKILLENNERLNELKLLIDATRRRKREENRDLDIFLYRWGYTDSLVHPTNQAPFALRNYRYGIVTGPPYALAQSIEIGNGDQTP